MLTMKRYCGTGFHSIGRWAGCRKYFRIERVFIVVALLLSWPALAQPEAKDAEAGVADAERISDLRRLQVAPVVVNGEELFRVVGVSSYTAEERAADIVQAIEVLARNPSFDPKSLRIVDEDMVHRIYPGKRRKPVITIVDQDAEIESSDREIIAEVFKARTAEIIEAYRNDRKPEVILSNVLHAIGRTLVLVAVLFGVFWGFRRLEALLEKQIKTRMKKLEAKSLRIIQSEQLWELLRIVLRVLRLLIVVVLVYVFLNFVLSLFPWTRHAAGTLLHFLVDPLAAISLAILNYVPSLIFLILLFFITRYVLRVLARFFTALGRERIHIKGFDADWALPTYRIVRVVVILFAVVLAYPYIPGSDSEAFKGISILFGVLFSLGSTSVISNVIAGYTMTYRRAFRIGDRVKIGGTIGDVMEMRVLVTHVRSLKNEEVVIPNSTILNNEVINYSKMAREHGLILHTTVGIGYEVPWRQVEAMLIMAAHRTPNILKQPEPFVLQTGLADFAVNYELNAYCGDEKQAMELYSGLHQNIQDVFNEYGIQIMTPSYRMDTPEPKIVPKDQWYAEPAAPLE